MNSQRDVRTRERERERERERKQDETRRMVRENPGTKERELDDDDDDDEKWGTKGRLKVVAGRLEERKEAREAGSRWKNGAGRVITKYKGWAGPRHRARQAD